MLLGDGENRTDCGADADGANEKGGYCRECGALNVVKIDRHCFAPVCSGGPFRRYAQNIAGGVPILCFICFSRVYGNIALTRHIVAPD